MPVQANDKIQSAEAEIFLVAAGGACFGNGGIDFTGALRLPGNRRFIFRCETKGLVMSYLVPSEFVTKMVDAGESKIFMSTGTR